MDPAVVTRFIDRLGEAFREGDAEVHRKSCETENIRILQTQYEAPGRGDVEAFQAFLAADVEFEVLGSPSIPFLGTTRGRSQVTEAIARNFSLIEDQTPELVSVVAQGDAVVVEGREQGRWRLTGEQYRHYWIHHFTFGDGKVKKIREYLIDTGPVG